MLKALLDKKPFSGFVVLFCLQLVCLGFIGLTLLRFSALDDSGQSRALRQALYSSHDLAYEARHLADAISDLRPDVGSSAETADSASVPRRDALQRFESQQQRLLQTLLDDKGWLVPRALVDPEVEQLRQAVEKHLGEALNNARQLLAVHQSLQQLEQDDNAVIATLTRRWHLLMTAHHDYFNASEQALNDFIGQLNRIDRQLYSKEQAQRQLRMKQVAQALAVLLLLQLGVWLVRYVYLRRFRRFCEQLESYVQTGFDDKVEPVLFRRLDKLRQGLEATLRLQGSELQKQHWKNIALDAAGEGILIADITGTIQYTNTAFTAITGYEASEVLGKNCNVLSSGQTDQETYQQLWRNIRSQGHWSGELINRRKEGVVYTQMTTIAGLYGDHPDTATPVLQGYVAVMRDISERKQMEQELKILATEDGLTGVLNRKTVLIEAQRCVQWAQRYNDPLAIIILDIDHFKAINDRWGHPVGDKAIIAVSRVCQSVVPEKGLFGRIGGEEFLLVLPGMNTVQAVDYAQQLRQAIEETAISLSSDMGQQVLQVTCSFGISWLNPGGSETGAGTVLETNAGFVREVHPPAERLSHLIAQADRALYEAKSSGRNCVRPTLTPEAAAAANLTKSVSRAF